MLEVGSCALHVYKLTAGVECSLACICTWRERKRTCPLCKATYGAVLASSGEAVSAAVSFEGLSRFTAFEALQLPHRAHSAHLAYRFWNRRVLLVAETLEVLSPLSPIRTCSLCALTCKHRLPGRALCMLHHAAIGECRDPHKPFTRMTNVVSRNFSSSQLEDM